MLGQFSGVQGEWQPTELGGSDIVRRMRAYAADHHTFGSKVSPLLNAVMCPFILAHPATVASRRLWTLHRGRERGRGERGGGEMSK